MVSCAAQYSEEAICNMNIQQCVDDECSEKSTQNISVTISPEYTGEYSRNLFGRGWLDTDANCQNTRAEILSRTSLIPVELDATGCKVAYGLWYDNYTDQIFESSAHVDIDHLVSLKEAFASGAWTWSDTRRTRFYNDIPTTGNLMPVWKSANRSKGSKEPTDWMPKATRYHCEYLNRWAFVKHFWDLSMDRKECSFVQSQLHSCRTEG